MPQKNMSYQHPKFGYEQPQRLINIPDHDWKIKCSQIAYDSFNDLFFQAFENYLFKQRQLAETEFFLRKQKYPIKFFTEANRPICKITCRVAYKNDEVKTYRGDKYPGNPAQWIINFKQWIEKNKYRIVEATIFDNFLEAPLDNIVFEYDRGKIKIDNSKQYL